MNSNLQIVKLEIFDALGTERVFNALENNSSILNIEFQKCVVQQKSCADALRRILEINERIYQWQILEFEISDENFEIVCQGIQNNKSLKDIYFGVTRFKCIRSLYSSLERNTSIESTRIKCTIVGIMTDIIIPHTHLLGLRKLDIEIVLKKGKNLTVSFLQNLLLQNTLQELSIKTSLNSDCFILLGQYLKMNVLKVLNLYDSPQSEYFTHGKDYQEILKSLADNNYIQELRIYFPNFHRGCHDMLKQFLAQNSSLQVFEIHHCKMEAAVLSGILDSARHNYNLKRLLLSGEIGGQVFHILPKLLRENYTLKELILHSQSFLPQIPSEYKNEIECSIKENFSLLYFYFSFGLFEGNESSAILLRNRKLDSVFKKLEILRLCKFDTNVLQYDLFPLIETHLC